MYDTFLKFPLQNFSGSKNSKIKNDNKIRLHACDFSQDINKRGHKYIVTLLLI